MHMYLFFFWREYPHVTILKAKEQSNKVSRQQLLCPTETSHDTKTPLMLITTYSRAKPNLRELISKHWSYVGRSRATGELGKQDFIITYRKPPSLKDMLVRAGIAQPTTPFSKGCNRPHTCKCCGRISQSGHIKSLHNNKTYNTLRNGTCQSNDLIYCLECNWCHTKHVGQTKNRIIYRFPGHICDIKLSNNTRVARHFHSHKDKLDPRMTIHILEYINLPKDIPRSNSLREKGELVWIHRPNTLILNVLNILD